MSTVNLVVGDDGANNLQGTDGSDFIYGYDPDGPQSDVTSITATRIASGLTQPVFAVAAPGDPNRLFVVEKTGLIRILDLASGQIDPTPFLDVSTEISIVGECGLLGLAFDPNFATNGFFYVYLINTSGDTEIRRYHVPPGSDQADPASATLVIGVDQPAATNHKAGWLGFGPDGYLYATLGDGGSDPSTAQDIDSLLGKILRLDVTADAFPGDPTRNYAIPADNMFVGVDGADEIFALGLRNPWRASFDSGLGVFYIADVGQSEWEEVDIGALGANYGWNIYEGPDVLAGGEPSAGLLTFPIHAYDHSVGSSITGGYVYRGPSEGLQGQYFFADFIASKIFTLHFDGNAWVVTERTAQIVTDVGSVEVPSAFAEDALGNLYVIDFSGEIFRLTPDFVSADQGDTLLGFGGDDTIFGGAGDDSIDGGEGRDTAAFSADVADYVITRDGTAVTVVGPDGTDTLTGIEWLRFADALVAVGQTASDFNVDGSADMLLRNGNGTLLVENVRANAVIGATVAGDVGTEWTAAGVEDFDGDGSGDVLFRHDDGTLMIDFIDANVVSGAAVLGQVGLEWAIAGIGDFNGDSIGDILFRRGDGTLLIENIGGNAVIGATVLGQVGLEWAIAGIGDFNGDATDDILFRRTDGAMLIETVSGNAVTAAIIAGVVGLEWAVVGTGDFNADGTSDILLREDDGTFQVQSVFGSQVIAADMLGDIGNEWNFVDIGDFNADLTADILLRHDDGTFQVWSVSDSQLSGTTILGQVGTEWTLV
jgi:glucose/arabinose dehydrogenase